MEPWINRAGDEVAVTRVSVVLAARREKMKPQNTGRITTVFNPGQSDWRSDALLLLSYGYYRIFACCKECLIYKRHESSKTASDLKLHCVCVCVCVLKCSLFFHFQDICFIIYKPFYLFFVCIDRLLKGSLLESIWICSSARVARSYTSSSGICGVHGGIGTGFSPITSVSFYQCSLFIFRLSTTYAIQS
jgi:hypothetical protein